MESSSTLVRTKGPALRLFSAADDDGQLTGGQLSGAMTLCTLYRSWFVPIVLVGEGRHAGTVTSYDESMEWWWRLTGDPGLAQIDEFTVAKFKTDLRAATWQRGKTGLFRPLSKFTQAKHLKQIRAVLRRAGPTVDPNRPGKHLVETVPHIRVSKPKQRRKEPFSLDQANQIAAATARMPPPRRPALWAIGQPDWWLALVLVFYYTGLRRGTILALRWSMIEDRDNGADPGRWLIIPGDIVKGDKPLEKFLHPIAAAAIDRIRTRADLIFAWPHCARHLNDRHEHLQMLAGIPEPKRLSLHAWRRTHATQMAMLGALHGRLVAQHTLAHEDERTTHEFYVDIEAQLIARLPPIDQLLLGSDDDGRQLKLF